MVAVHDVALPSNVDGLQIEVTSRQEGFPRIINVNGRDMDRKKEKSSNLFLLRLKSICGATRDFDFYKLTIEMHWKFYTTVMICSCILVNRFPLFHCPSPNRYCR